jgi:hypothetical protein
MTDHAREDEIAVRVSFPISKHGTYEHDFNGETTVGTVLGLAMRHFEVENDPQFDYVLAHDGQEQNPATTLRSLALHAEALHFTLVKKITQG